MLATMRERLAYEGGSDVAVPVVESGVCLGRILLASTAVPGNDGYVPLPSQQAPPFRFWRSRHHDRGKTSILHHNCRGCVSKV
jgi:hypothetical protein